jgi:hypothetical protein
MRPENFFEYIWDCIDSINKKYFAGLPKIMLSRFQSTVIRIEESRQELIDIKSQHTGIFSEDMINEWIEERRTTVAPEAEDSDNSKYAVLLDNAFEARFDLFFNLVLG